MAKTNKAQGSTRAVLRLMPLILAAVVSACGGSPNDPLNDACGQAAPTLMGANASEQTHFCACVESSAEALSPAARSALTVALAEHAPGKDIAAALEAAVAREDVTFAEARAAFGTIKGCSVDAAV